MIFVDTSFWVGVSDGSDTHHRMACRLIDKHASPLVTTNHVLGETWTFFRRRHGHADAMRFIDRVEGAETVDIAFVMPDLEHEAWSWLRRHDERRYSFVDATSFALMRRLKIHQALAFDGDFAAAGFVELRA